MTVAGSRALADEALDSGQFGLHELDFLIKVVKLLLARVVVSFKVNHHIFLISLRHSLESTVRFSVSSRYV